MNKKLYIIAFVVLIVVFISVKVSAEETEQKSIGELSEQRKLVQDQIAENRLQLDELQGEISDLMLGIQELSDKIYKYEIEVEVLDKEISELDSKVKDVERKFNVAQKMYNNQKDLLSRRIIAQYEEGEIIYLDFLLNSNGLTELISNYYLIGEIAEYDNELLDNYKAQKEQIATIKIDLEKNKEELKKKRDEQEKASIVLINTRTVKNNQMSRLSEQEQQLQKQIDEYQAEVQKIEVELLMLLTQNIGSDYVGGVLAWPVPGYTTITSNYGMRVHPISGLYKLHTGVDIGAPSGAYFVAANDGTVVTSTYSASYGNMVVIDHGGGVSTLYAHGTQRLVQVGDNVKRGQPVLTVGSTGMSTGPHAHFEVRVNGRWVDPLEYILKQKESEAKENETNTTENMSNTNEQGE